MSGQLPTEPVDVLAIGAHPDDVELFCGGTLALLARAGFRIGMVHLTRGECGTRGTQEIRAQESRIAAEILDASWVHTMNLGDGKLADGEPQRRAIVELIRQARPRVILGHGKEDRHPDHSAAHRLMRSTSFLANVGGFEAAGERHEVGAVVYFQGHERRSLLPADWIVDITETYASKRKALEAYATQFKAAEGDSEPATYISSAKFWNRIETTACRLGDLIGVEYAEAFSFREPPHRGHPFVQLFEKI